MKEQTKFDKFLTSSYGFPMILFAVLLFWFCCVITAQNKMKKSYQEIFKPDELRFANICMLDADWEKACRKTESSSYDSCCNDEDTYRLWKKQNQSK